MLQLMHVCFTKMLIVRFLSILLTLGKRIPVSSLFIFYQVTFQRCQKWEGNVNIFPNWLRYKLYYFTLDYAKWCYLSGRTPAVKWLTLLSIVKVRVNLQNNLLLVQLKFSDISCVLNNSRGINHTSLYSISLF